MKWLGSIRKTPRRQRVPSMLVSQGGGLLRVYSCSDVVANRCRFLRGCRYKRTFIGLSCTWLPNRVKPDQFLIPSFRQVKKSSPELRDESKPEGQSEQRYTLSAPTKIKHKKFLDIFNREKSKYYSVSVHNAGFIRKECSMKWSSWVSHGLTIGSLLMFATYAPDDADNRDV